MELIDVILGIFAVCLVAVVAYRGLTEIYGYWKRQNVPFVPAKPLIGSIDWKTMNKPLQEIETEWYNRYGRIYGRFEATKPVLSVGDPDILRNILSTDFQIFPNRRDLKFHDPVMDNTLFVLEGDAWSRVRNIVSPAFTTSKLKRMFPLLTECSDLLVERFAEVKNKTEDLNCQEYYGAFVLSAIARCAFGMNISAIRDPKNVFVEKSKKLFYECLSWRTYLTILCPVLMKIFRLKLLNPETTGFYRNTIIQVLEERKKLNLIRDDFLQMLIDAEDANNNGADIICEKGGCKVSTQPKIEKKGLTHDEMLSQSVTFFIAGFDATTSLLSHVTYRLAMHQNYQQMVVDEMKDALNNHNGKMCYDALSEMKFLNAVIHECLRMCPAMVRHERRAEQDYQIQSRKIHLKKGTIVSIPVYAMHHDPEWYPEPEVFKPERFYPEELRAMSRYNYLPFGNGKRMCVGMRFVHIQVKLCIAKLLMKFQIMPAPSTPQTLGYTESRNVLTVNKVEVRLMERQLY
ncbi:Cytochrome P450 3A24 like protein [Argiope bruennichi]|uniref:Cytochrome P450 3A24 like protein n=1 Tax=Argiope bruennichi TaxID=94029 RepID=A0A8T0DYN7_ARGBR|nr:Cytochrome P450 3A24 like protein [Argiope bruennichi]